MSEIRSVGEWILLNDGDIDINFKVVTIAEGNRTLVSSLDKKVGDVIAKIPKKCTFRVRDKNQYLVCLDLLCEISRGEESPFYAYIDSLPDDNSFRNYPTYLYRYSDIEEIREFCPSFAEKVEFNWKMIMTVT